MLNSSISSSRSPNEKKFAILIVSSCARILGEYVQKVSKKWIIRL
jgi:hypothetical protein